MLESKPSPLCKPYFSAYARERESTSHPADTCLMVTTNRINASASRYYRRNPPPGSGAFSRTRLTWTVQ